MSSIRAVCLALSLGVIPHLASAADLPGQSDARPETTALDQIETIVVIYAENRSFDNLYGYFPGANGLRHLPKRFLLQRDRDGSPLAHLPPIWDGIVVGRTPPLTMPKSGPLPNRPFAIDGPTGFNLPLDVVTPTPTHLFYQHQMQLDGGHNDRFVAYAGSTGSLTLGHYHATSTKLPLWKLARRYTLADNFFMAAFGGSFLNHQWLACACTPLYPNADQSPAKGAIAAVEPDGVSLTLAPSSPKSALGGPPRYQHDGLLTPDFHAVNTVMPTFAPQGHHATPANTLPPKTSPTIGDLLSDKGVSWAWYAGAWQYALDGTRSTQGHDPKFQPHHQPFNYFASFAPGTAARAEHLRDGGLDGSAFIAAIDQGTLPKVSFYKPQGSLDEHAGYADVLSGDRHIAELVAHLEKSPQWPHMLVIVTYDENGGFWDHVPPPKGDRWGPGSRIPAIIISPFAKRHHVDHTQYDTTSILRFITRRFGLPTLKGIVERDQALARNGSHPMGDLTAALVLKPRLSHAHAPSRGEGLAARSRHNHRMGSGDSLNASNQIIVRSTILAQLHEPRPGAMTFPP